MNKKKKKRKLEREKLSGKRSFYLRIRTAKQKNVCCKGGAGGGREKNWPRAGRELNRLIGAERVSQSQAKTKKPKSKNPKKKTQVRNQRSNQTESKQRITTTNNKATRRRRTTITTTRDDLKLKEKGREGSVEKGTGKG